MMHQVRRAVERKWQIKGQIVMAWMCSFGPMSMDGLSEEGTFEQRPKRSEEGSQVDV